MMTRGFFLLQSAAVLCVISHFHVADAAQESGVSVPAARQNFMTSLIKSSPTSREINLTLRLNYLLQPEALTTERVNKLDPAIRNPHRQRWALGREIELLGLQSVSLSDGRFGVMAEGILVNMRGQVRGEGPWYRPDSEFPCSGVETDQYSTLAGAQFAVGEGARVWKELLASRKLKLELLLKQVSASTPNIAYLMAEHVFQIWLSELESFWMKEGIRFVRSAEWKQYLLWASHSKKCAKMPPSIVWENMMEPLPALGVRKLLARAPARRWNGLYSVRLSLVAGLNSLNGIFLIDSGATKSLLSAEWLEGQGLPVSRIEIPASVPEKVTWMKRFEWMSGLAKPAKVEEAEISGYPLNLKYFLIYPTEFFAPPQTLATCCDGVLGGDFLRRFVVEFRPGPPTEVLIWNPDYFLPEGDYEWIELGMNEQGETVSSCLLNGLGPVFWDTANPETAEVRSSLGPKSFSKESFNRSKLQCLGKDFETALRVKPMKQSGEEGASFAPVSLGMNLLGRSEFIFDLPHGRLWLPRSVHGKPIPENHSGLQLVYGYHKGERVLRVDKVSSHGLSVTLVKAGLKPGMIITQIDQKPTEDLDQWEVDRRLSGVYADQVILQWDAKKQIKIVPFKIR